MRVLIIGATGTIGAAVARAVAERHEVIPASQTRSALKVDLAVPDSIRSLYATVGKVDAVVSAAGAAAFRPLLALSDADFSFSLANKLMGQVNLVRFGIDVVAEGGCFILTSGTLSRHPTHGGAAISIVNAGLEGFVRAAALELPRVRVNAVAPGWVRETLQAMKMDPTPGMPAAIVAQAYVRLLEGRLTGQVVDVVQRP